MIVRISGEDQYRLDDSHHESLNELDNAVLAAVQAGDEDAFDRTYRQMLEFVRSRGAAVGQDEIEISDVILPPPDLTLVEAGSEFTGDGLIPD